MNLKVAKELRRLATVLYDKLPDENRQPAGTYQQHNQFGFIRTHPLSPRGIYRRLKREYIVRAKSNQVTVKQG